MFRSSARASTDTDVVVEIAPSGSPTAPEAPNNVATIEVELPGGFRRRMERARGLFEERDLSASRDQEDRLRLQVMLLQEENARLKADRHKPADPGTLIEEVRVLRDSSEVNELLDDAWSVLGECLALREGLDRVCIEIQAAMASVRERLSTLGVTIESLPGEGGQKRGDQEASLSA